MNPWKLKYVDMSEILLLHSDFQPCPSAGVRFTTNARGVCQLFQASPLPSLAMATGTGRPWPFISLAMVVAPPEQADAACRREKEI
jgi:hypothetical protein